MRYLFLFFASFCYAYETSSKLTLEEKVGQLLMCHFNGEVANAEAFQLIQECHVGGIVYYNWSNGLTSKEQVKKLSDSLQKIAPIPLLIATDQEGGRVARLKNGFFQVEGNAALGKSGDLQRAENEAFSIGKDLIEVGINLNFAPVVDINSNPNNPVIGSRAYGNTFEIVIPMAKAALEGFHESGVLTCLKHFPGHGDVSIDSHLDLPILNKKKEALENFELKPFYALAPYTDCVMTAHLLIPSIDSNHAATLSKSILDILRVDIGFKGVIISDSLVMEGLLKNAGGNIDDACILCFNAGCDILLLGGKQLFGQNQGFELTPKDVSRIFTKLVEAVRAGIISEKRLNESVDRIFTLKENLKDFSYSQ